MSSPDYVNKNRTVSVPLESFFSPGDYILTAAVPYLAGVRPFIPVLLMSTDQKQSGGTDILYFSQNITLTE